MNITEQYSILHRWTPSKGDDAFWIGGPRHDHNEPNTFSGGYVFLETSSLAEGQQETKVPIIIGAKY